MHTFEKKMYGAKAKEYSSRSMLEKLILINEIYFQCIITNDSWKFMLIDIIWFDINWGWCEWYRFYITVNFRNGSWYTMTSSSDLKPIFP